MLIDCVGFVDGQTLAEFAEADPDTRQAMRAQLARLEAALVAERTADLPVVDGSRAITAIVVTSRLPDEDDVWRLAFDDEDASDPGRRAAIERRDAKIAEAQAEARREQAQRKPMAERDHDPSGPEGEWLYTDMPSGYPVTRAQHRVRLGSI